MVEYLTMSMRGSSSDERHAGDLRALLHRIHETHREIVRRGRTFGDDALAVHRKHQVGEGAADVDVDGVHRRSVSHGRSLLLRCAGVQLAVAHD